MGLQRHKIKHQEWQKGCSNRYSFPQKVQPNISNGAFDYCGMTPFLANVEIAETVSTMHSELKQCKY